MELEATAQALAPETALPEPVATETTTDADYGAVYDKAASDSPVEVEPEKPVEAPVEVETPVEVTPAKDVPSILPEGIKKHWQTIPEEAREAFTRSQTEMSRANAEMGRLVSGLEPIRSVLNNAVKELPALANMRPDEVAQEVVQLAKISADFRSKPLETFLSLAQKHNMVDALKQALGGNQPAAQETAQLQSELRAVKEQLARAADPEFIRAQVSAVTAQERIVSDVGAFAKQQEHWNAEIPGVFREDGTPATIEDSLPGHIKQLQWAMPKASPQDILARAYEVALTTHRPDLKAPVKAAVEAAPQPDPERTQAAIQAKSVNVPNRTTGKQRELTEEEAYSAVFDRAARR
jgi:hypothetical protein